MLEKIQKEYEAYENSLKSNEESLELLTLLDIVGNNLKIKKEGEDITRDFSGFDDKVIKIKELLGNVKVEPTVNLSNSIRDSLTQYDNISKECEISMRILKWLEEETKEEEKKDA